MKGIGEILKSRAIPNNVNNDNKYNNDNNVNGLGKKKSYALDKSKFKPNTPEALLAETIANYFGDIENFAFHLRVVKNIGYGRTDQLFRTVKQDILEKKTTKYPVRFPKKYYVWCSRNLNKLGI